MAKILFVTQKLTENSLNQIEIIKRSGHDFTVITSQSEKLRGLVHSDVLYLFSKWNFFELLKFMPSFLVINPDIVHVFVDSKESVSFADFFASLSHIFRKVFSLQFFLSENTFLNTPKAKKMVYLADIVTGPHRAFLYNLRGMPTKNKYQIKGVIPPVLQLASPAKTKSTDLDSLEFKNYKLFVPLKNDPAQIDVLIALARRFPLLIVAELQSWSASEIKKLNYRLAKSNGQPWRLWPVQTLKDLSSLPLIPLPIWVAGLDFELDECIQFFEFSLNRKIKIVMDQSQSRLYPELWEGNPMADILNKNDMENSIAHYSINEFTGNRRTDSIKSSTLVDISVNEFNRLISKATNIHNEKTI